MGALCWSALLTSAFQVGCQHIAASTEQRAVETRGAPARWILTAHQHMQAQPLTAVTSCATVTRCSTTCSIRCSTTT